MAGVAKISVSLERGDVAWAKTTAKRRKMTVSAVIAEALAQKRQAEARARLLDMLGASDITAEDEDAMRRELAGMKRGRRHT
jgi:hypothetical protein